MARPLASVKRSVNLGAAAKAGSRIRRDPPPPPPKPPLLDPEDRDRLNTAIGIIAFALAIAVIVGAVSLYAGWSPGDYTWELRTAE